MVLTRWANKKFVLQTVVQLLILIIGVIFSFFQHLKHQQAID
jgi:hypothetical protein